MLPWILGLFKPTVLNLVAELQANETENVAAIEATVTGGETSVSTAVTNFLTTEAKKNAELGIIVPLFEPVLLGELSALEQQGSNTVPALYAAGIAWLQKEETYL